MNEELVQQLQTGQAVVDAPFKALRGLSSALKQATRLASQEHLDALPMQKALAKLDQALEVAQAEGLVDDAVRQARDVFAAATQEALNALAFSFARELKAAFEERGETVEGRPPTLVVGDLVLQIDVTARKAQWFYGKEPLTKPLALSLNAILKAYDQQRRRIVERSIDVDGFLGEVYTAWEQAIAERSRRPAGGRIGIVEIYSKVVLNRQSNRFWNQPSRSTFRDYERPLFVRDLVLARENPVVEVEGKPMRLRLGVATKSQAESASRSIWLPNTALDGEYYSDLTFEEG